MIKSLYKAAVVFLVASTFIGFASEANAQKRKQKSTTATAAGSELLWSGFKGSFQQFIDRAITTGVTAVLDKDITISQTVAIHGDLRMQGNGHSITHKLEKLFEVGHGTHVFENMNIIQQADNSNAFFTVQKPRIVWNNTLRGITITGGENGYNSSLGGVYDKQTDSVLQWAGTTIENSIIKIKGGMAIAIFSQDGPCKYLHLRNVQLGSEVTHNIYTHPNVSMSFDSVVSLYAGKLALHYFSGGNDWMYYTARYFTMNRVSSVNGANWEMVRPKAGCIRITNSNIAPYTLVGVEPPLVCAENSQFYNAGNGARLSGTLTNCSGTVWSAGPEWKPLELKGGSYDEVNFKAGGTIIANNSNISRMLIGEKDVSFGGSFSQCRIAELEDFGNGKGQLELRNSPTQKNNSKRIALIK